MKQNIIILALMGIIAFVAVSCNKSYDGYYDKEYYETSTEFLTLRNFSSDSTVWFIPERDCADNLPESLSEWQKISIFELAPHSSYVLSFDSNDSYVTPVETYEVNDRIAIYVFKRSVWQSHSWAELVSGKMWSGYCRYSVDEMIELRQIVTYPMK